MIRSLTRRSVLASGTAALAVLALAACGSSSDGGSSDKKVSLTIGAVQPTSAFSLAQIATDAGLWPEGLDVKVTVTQSSTAAATLATNRVQMVIAASPQLDVAAANSKAAYHWVGQWQNPSDFQFIASAGHPDLKSLKGSKIGVTFAGSTTDILAQSALLKAGLTKSDYTVTPLESVGAMVGALTAGTIDGFVLPSSIVQPILKEEKDSALVYNFFTPDFPWIGAGILANDEFAEDHPEAVQDVLRGLDAALKYLRSNPDDAKKSVGTWIKSQDQAQVDGEYQSLLDTFSEEIQPVDPGQLKQIYGHLRSVTGNDKISDQLAEGLVEDKYLEAVHG